MTMSRISNRCQAFAHQRLRTVASDLSQDILRYLNKSPENRAAGDTRKTRLGAFLTPQLLCLFVYRVAHWFHVNRWRRVASWLSRANLVLHKVHLPPQSCIGPGCFLPHPAGVTFCGTAGSGLTLYSIAVCCPLQANWNDPLLCGPQLGDRVMVGGHAAVLGPVLVGDDVKIAFSVRLACDAPAGVLVVSKAQRARVVVPDLAHHVPASDGG